MDQLFANRYFASFLKQYPYLPTLFLFLGGFTFLKFAVKTFVVFAEIFILSGINLKKFGAGKGAWAVVTGASDGIGREYALQLAKKGFNILVVARNETRLTSVTDEITSTCGPQIQTKRIVLDFSHDDTEAWARLEQAVAGLNIGVLVNNVGMSHAHPIYFVESSAEEMRDIITINVTGTLRMSRIIVPGMVQRKRGLVLNVSSFASVVPSPLLTTYSSSKAFVDNFTTALAHEVAPHGVLVQTTNPYFVVSKMSKIRKQSMMAPTPKMFVRASLSKIGLNCGSRWTGRPACSTPYWSHAIFEYLVGCLGMKQASIGVAHWVNEGVKKRVDRKLAREAKSR